MDIQISLVIPINNERKNIEELTNEVLNAVGNYDSEIIYVDDGSTDDSLDLLKQLQEKHQNIRILSHSKNYGQSAALRTGISTATKDIIAVLDGDGQNDPADIPKLIEALVNHSHVGMVIGHREKRRDNAWRRLSSRFAFVIRRFIFNDPIRDTGCGIKVFFREAYLTLPYFDHMHRYLPILFRAAGYDVIASNVNHRPRMSGHSHYGTLDRLANGIVDVLGVIWLLHRQQKTQFSEIKPSASATATAETTSKPSHNMTLAG